MERAETTSSARTVARPGGRRRSARGRATAKPSGRQPTELEEFLAARGILLGLSLQRVQKHLRALLGEDRFAELDGMSDAVYHGRQPVERLYALPRTIQEVHTLFSVQSDLMVASFAKVTELLAELPQVPRRIVDLGCATGLLAGWLARHFPDTDVVGVDRVAGFLTMARESEYASNARFRRWDYGRSRPPASLRETDVLVSTVGIDFEPRCDKHRGLDLHDLRGSDEYRRARKEASRYLERWLDIAAPEATLVTVLRLRTFDEDLAFIDAAAATGWAWKAGRSSILRTRQECFPVLVFRAERGPLPEIDAVLEFRAQSRARDLLGQSMREGAAFFDDAAAALVYRNLRARKPTETRSHTYGDGHTMVKERGRIGSNAYIFARATTGFTQLEIAPTDEELFVLTFDF